MSIRKAFPHVLRGRTASRVITFFIKPLILLLTNGLIIGNGQASDRVKPDLVITLSRAPETPQDTLSLQATIKNVSTHDVIIGFEGPLIDYVSTLRYVNVKAVPLSSYGKEVFSKDRISWSMSVMITLRPGETRTDTWDITKLYDLAMPARYRVTVERTMGQDRASISSNTLTVFLGVSQSR